MSKMFSRRYGWILLGILALAALVPVVGFNVHAAGVVPGQAQRVSQQPSLSTSVTNVRVGEKIKVTARGFQPGEHIRIQLDINLGLSLTTLAADHRGTATGSFVLPRTSIAAGVHLLVALGERSHLKATVVLVFIPVINALQTDNGLISLTGSSFASNEQVRITIRAIVGFGGSCDRTAQANGLGNLTSFFSCGSGLNIGVYLVTVYRTNHTPSQLTTQLRITLNLPGGGQGLI